ncbi:bis(5'-nucleosyl)-tetraphosphatase (symmetrical) YqeK [Jeotgalibacillus haloalkalitolerans]|uniref:bis(5'-nucleosyl)-tetraphosphatase (symmetrical) n=1 Tax=Jeotgalibacillus haloalkalitolerans TaxID=3104292 RepID=A0ABU5KMD2_9BACL|nr:bis(5'-nucleosyl)-tetraphosphatase (symmetrical) YqeK [Jeotgalibacillus sp. HH7-29]MDZ5712292.1 bis(5'-nucleosyl)-tetraphosphatase (symmetrical) YqeK [Jeotgalibacillus sp. HH7-29]
MNLEQAKQIVKDILPEKRYIHTLGVIEAALSLAEKHGVSIEDAGIAAALHDMAKFHDKNEMRELIISRELDPVLLDFHHELWHAPVGAVFAREKLGITNEDILNAIRYHTTGRPNMSRLEKVIYLADYIEPGRSFTGVDNVRAVAHENLDEAMKIALKQSMQFLISKNQPVFPDTLESYNEFVQKEK